MKSMLFVLPLFTVFALACDDARKPSNKTVLVLANDECQNVEEVCQESFPVVCHSICNDPSYDDYAPDCAVSSDGKVLCPESDVDCIDVPAEVGKEILLCAPAGCTVELDDNDLPFASCISPPSGE